MKDRIQNPNRLTLAGLFFPAERLNPDLAVQDCAESSQPVLKCTEDALSIVVADSADPPQDKATIHSGQLGKSDG